MMLELVSCLEEATAGAEVVVLRAAGADFTLGRDQSERVPGVSREENLRLILDVNRLLAEFDGVTVAVVRGRALGFGSGLALHSDLVVAADTAVLGFDELVHGFPPLVVLSYLTRHVPHKAALDLVLTARQVPAPEARLLGMVSRVVPEPELEATADALVARLLGFDARAVRGVKRFMRSIEDVPPDARPAHALGELVAWFAHPAGTPGPGDATRPAPLRAETT
jgi:enoyl-CoA hydratase/carnithine racemase